MSEQIRVWITKYALSEGIQEEVAKHHGGLTNMISIQGGMERYFHGEGKDWHRTLESAKDRAEAMRQAKIKSLKKQIAKLEAMKF